MNFSTTFWFIEMHLYYLNMNMENKQKKIEIK